MRAWPIALVFLSGCFNDVLANDDPPAQSEADETGSGASDDGLTAEDTAGQQTGGDPSWGGSDDESGDEPEEGSDGEEAGSTSSDADADSGSGSGAPGGCSADDSSGCPLGCIGDSFDGHDYAFCTEWVGWVSARQVCQSIGGDLVRIETADENEFLQTTTVLNFNELETAWVGARDAGSGAEGEWRWQDDENPFWTVVGGAQDGAFVNWYSDEPNDAFLGEDCGALAAGDLGWADLPCANTMPHICEVP